MTDNPSTWRNYVTAEGQFVKGQGEAAAATVVVAAASLTR